MAAKKGSRLNWLNILIFLWFATGLACVVPTVLVGPFLFDSPGSSGSPLPWLVLGSLISFPVVSIISGMGTWALKSRFKYPALALSLLPLLSLGLIGLIFVGMSLFAPQKSNNTVQVQAPPMEAGGCGGIHFDGGDGLATTGCGLVGIGQTVTGTTRTTSEAHNWEFEIMGSIPIPISIKNDGKTCPQLVILDSSGKVVESFARENARKCTGGGVVETQVFTFKQHGPGNQTYTLRVSMPKTPGSY